MHVTLQFRRSHEFEFIVSRQEKLSYMYSLFIRNNVETCFRREKFKVLVEWIQFVYEMVAVLVQTIKTKNPNRKFATEAEILTKIITLRRPCEMLGRLRRPMIEWRHETVRWRHYGRGLYREWWTPLAIPQGTGTVTLSIPFHYVTSLVHYIGRKRQF